MSSSTVPGAENTVAGDGSSALPVAWWSAASPVGGDVVLSGVVLLFVALALAFVLYHYFTVKVSRCSRRRGTGGTAGVVAGTTTAPSSSAGQQQHATLLAGGGGLDPSVLRALPVTVYEANKEDRAGEAVECAVCLGELADDGEAACRFLPRCGHGFHAECIDLWLRGHSTCPLCRVHVHVDLLPPVLPPVLPAEPANYHPTTNLPTNVLFWGSSLDAVTVARTTVDVHGGPSAPAASGVRASPPPMVIHVRETGTAVDLEPDPAPAAREDDVEKARGLARLSSSLRRLWSRWRHA